MKRESVSEGMEVNHSKYGRGCVVDPMIVQSEGINEVLVFFYLRGEEEAVPVYSLSPAEEVTSIESTAEPQGITVTIDDGFYTLHIEPDGKGTGYSVTLRSGHATIDTTHLSSAEFL